jgi:hypothetical protein
MRLSRIVAVALLAVALGPGAREAGAQTRQRQLCRTYRCTVVAEDSQVRVVRVQSRAHGEESEAELGHSVHWAIWRPSGRAWPLQDWDVTMDSIHLRKLALAGPWVADATQGCSHETESCTEGVKRMRAQTGQIEYDLGGGPDEPAGRECLTGYLGDAGQPVISALRIATSGTMAWIQVGRVCELPHGSQVPLLLASSPAVVPNSLQIADGFLIWREGGALGSAPLA